MVYINGAIAEPWEKTRRNPNKANIIKIGTSQNFFLTKKNWNISIIKFIKIAFSYFVDFLIFQSNNFEHFC